ncbi:MAG: CBS domain-containing protein [Deltaproteobacteria bacterium]|nr:CBS domain-containing protein [Deltaproteobacteria bacterium]
MARFLCAGDMMSTQLCTATADEIVCEVVSRLRASDQRAAPVLDAAGTLVGMLHEQDALRALLRGVDGGGGPARVGDVMQRDPVGISEDTPFLTLAHAFTAGTGLVLPVVREGRVVGTLGRRELLDAALSLFRTAPSREAAVLYLSATDHPAPAWLGTPHQAPERRR